MSVVFEKSAFLVKAIVTIDNQHDVLEMKCLDHCKKLLSGICLCLTMIVFSFLYKVNIIGVSGIWSFLGLFLSFRILHSILFVSLVIPLKIDEETNSIYKRYGFNAKENRDKIVRWVAKI